MLCRLFPFRSSAFGSRSDSVRYIFKTWAFLCHFFGVYYLLPEVLLRRGGFLPHHRLPQEGGKLKHQQVDSNSNLPMQNKSRYIVGIAFRYGVAYRGRFGSATSCPTNDDLYGGFYERGRRYGSSSSFYRRGRLLNGEAERDRWRIFFYF